MEEEKINYDNRMRIVESEQRNPPLIEVTHPARMMITRVKRSEINQAQKEGKQLNLKHEEIIDHTVESAYYYNKSGKLVFLEMVIIEEDGEAEQKTEG